MKRVTFSVLFFIKKKKLLKNGDARIYVRITVNNLSVVNLRVLSMQSKVARREGKHFCNPVHFSQFYTICVYFSYSAVVFPKNKYI
jgi:hypothetical protein